MQNNTSLHARLGKAGRRLRLIGLAGGLLWGLFAAMAVLLFAAWLDLAWELSPTVRIAFNWGAAALGSAVLAIQAFRVGRAARPAALARRLDIAAKSCGAILTGWELESSAGGLARFAQEKTLPLTIALAKMATEYAASLARRAPLTVAVPVKPLGRVIAAFTVLAAAIELLAMATPGLVTTEWNRFRRPQADLPPFSLLTFRVEPGDTSLHFGNDLEISAAVEGPAVDHLELVIERRDGSQSYLPMFSEAGGKWRTVLSRFTEPATYFVRSYSARSAKYNIAVATVPQVETVRIKVVQPAKGGRNSYEGPLPSDGVKGRRGSTVTVWATSNVPLSGGKLTVTSRPEANRKAGDRDAVHISSTFIQPMQPTKPGGQEVVGQFQISGEGTFVLQVIDEAGRVSRQSFCGDWHENDDRAGNPDVVAPGDAAVDKTARSVDYDAVPPKYRRAVQQYFRRLSKESGNRGK